MADVNTENTQKTEDTVQKEENGKKKGFFSEAKIEMFAAIFLGITALLMAWATWIGSLHGGNQSTNYTKSNNIASEGNSEYNSGLQTYLSDLMAWNSMMDYQFDIEIANLNEKYEEAELIQTKLNAYIQENSSEYLMEAFEWMNRDDVSAESPFEMPGLIDKYFENANALLAESQELLEQGQKDNSNGDKFGLVTVIYSVVLFMLGIIGVFKKLPNRKVVLLIAIVGLVAATVYMFTIPMPTDFSFTSYFKS